jgi:uncharacterized protein (DUF342 family)
MSDTQDVVPTVENIPPVDVEIKDEKKMTGRERSLANLKPIKKGEVRNPNGRGKKTDSYSDIAKELLSSKKIDIEIEYATPAGTKTKKLVMTSKNSIKHQMICAMIHSALSGNLAAAKDLLERVDGKVKDKIEHSGSIGDGVKLPETVEELDEKISEIQKRLEK